MSRNRYIAIDFDGTCVTQNYPHIGADVPGAVEALQQLNALGVKLILWTCRSGQPLDRAVQWFSEREITLFGVNHNPDLPWPSPKIYADYYFDDKTLGPTKPYMAGPNDTAVGVDPASVFNWAVALELLEFDGFFGPDADLTELYPMPQATPATPASPDLSQASDKAIEQEFLERFSSSYSDIEQEVVMEMMELLAGRDDVEIQLPIDSIDDQAKLDHLEEVWEKYTAAQLIERLP